MPEGDIFFMMESSLRRTGRKPMKPFIKQVVFMSLAVILEGCLGKAKKEI